MDGYKVKVQVQIVAQGAAGWARADGDDGLSGIDAEIVETIGAQQAASLDDMEATLLHSAYCTMRLALGRHFEAVSKRGLWSGCAAVKS